MNHLWGLLHYNEAKPLLFTQANFWLFFAFVLLIYQLVYQKNILRNVFLMLVSLFFYYKSSGFFFTILIFSTVVDYVLGNLVFKEKRQSIRKLYVFFSLVINLALLGYFKYTYFLADTLNTLFAANISITNWMALFSNQWFGTAFDVNNIFLPVGISFYTFQTMSYTIDIYRNRIEPVKNIFDFAFYVSFFPQLVAGPIVRANEFVPQIYQPYLLNRTEMSQAIFLILNGLTKKILISDYLSVNFIDRIFDNPTTYSGFENLLAVYGYAIQIYCDFSGYTDIAIGLSLLLGYRLPLNFNSPYKSVNITDFWRRWHISLSAWLRDYLYISLGGNRKGRFRTYLNLILTMLLGGLWHGAAWRFVVWGALHGIALALHKLYIEWSGHRSEMQYKWYTRLLYQAITFHFVCFCWIYFRAKDMATVQEVISQITMQFQPEVIWSVISGYYKIVSLMLLAYLVHWLPTTWKEQVKNRFIDLPSPVQVGITFLVVIIIYQAKTAGIQPFIYFQF
jgi:D-alanyl-lipoteichoic acid acyltransferase DltB (MBOAT superfamily)